ITTAQIVPLHRIIRLSSRLRSARPGIIPLVRRLAPRRGGRGMERTLSTSAWLLVAVMTCLPTSARAQELRPDSVWDRGATGAAVGAGLGLIIAKTTDDICSAPACASLLAVAGGALGRVTDGLIGKRAPVQPGQRIDDPVANGALIGAGVGPGLVLIDLAR